MVQGSLQQPVYTVGFKPSTHGTLNFGYVDSSLYTGDLVTAPVDARWETWYVNAITLSAGKAKVTQPMVFGMYRLLHRIN